MGRPVTPFDSCLDRSGADGCHIWTRCRTTGGYGQRWFNGRMHCAHRVAWELARGPIPAGLELDHICRNRLCCNPDHLEPVTHAENVRRGELGRFWATKAHCPHGHPYSDENTYRDSHGHRHCRACNRAQSRIRRTV